MAEYQRTLYGKWQEPLQTTTVADRCAAALEALGNAVDPNTRAIYSWMMDETVRAFCRIIPQITTFDEAWQEYVNHLERKNGVFETEARETRRAAQLLQANGATGVDKKQVDKLLKPLETAQWYKAYLKTKHWAGIKVEARLYYGSCVLCGLTKGLETHHRHYNAIGKEDMHDVSLLCEQHHRQVTPLLGMRVPRIVPPGALAVFRTEGVDITGMKGVE